jgi:Protein of unknown function (DUF1153)
MAEPYNSRVNHVIGPDGSLLTLADLPRSTTVRWTVMRKAKLVAAVSGGLLSVEDACSRYNIATEEFLSWQRLIDQHGIAGLRTTRTQQYRNDSSTARFYDFISRIRRYAWRARQQGLKL